VDKIVEEHEEGNIYNESLDEEDGEEEGKEEILSIDLN